MDYLYQFIFVYKGLLFSAAYVLLAKADEIGGKINLCEGDIAGKIVIAVSALILAGAIHSVFAWPVEHFKMECSTYFLRLSHKIKGNSYK